jgi:hypothetical protein
VPMRLRLQIAVTTPLKAEGAKRECLFADATPRPESFGGAAHSVGAEMEISDPRMNDPRHVAILGIVGRH